MKTKLLGAVVSLIAVLVLLLSLPGGTLGHNFPSAENELTSLGPSFASEFPDARDTGTMSPNSTMTVGVSLDLKDAPGLAAFSQEVSTPGNMQYHQFISSTEFTDRYAPTPYAYSQAESYFQGYGLHIQTIQNRLILLVSGSPLAMGDAFHTTFSNFALADGQTYYGPVGSPSTPTSLGVAGVSGFTNAFRIEPADLGTLPKAHATTQSCPNTVGSSSTYTPSQIENAYGVNQLIGAGSTGAGETVGIVDVYDADQSQDTLASDLSTFDSDCGLPTPTVNYVYPPQGSTNYNTTVTGWGGEEALDMQWVHSIAPGATIDMTFATTDDAPYLELAADFLVAQDVVNVISMSFGLPDATALSVSGLYALFHPIFEAAAAEGISAFASSGDCGAADGTSGVSTQYPASDQDVTGVGATVLTLSDSGGYGSETAWSGNESGSCNDHGGSGGGWAPTTQPWYQSGEGVVSNGLRGVPDVSLDGGSWLDVIVNETFVAIMGTSASCPQWAGLAAISDQLHGGDLGLLNPEIYSILGSSSYSSYFYDITSGSNGYNTGPGWDPVTGVGSPIANALVPVLSNFGYIPPQNGMSVTLKTSGSGLTYTFTASASGGSGSYLYSFNFGDGYGTTTTDASVEHTYSVADDYFPNVIAYDSKGNASVSNFNALTPSGDTQLSETLLSNVSTITAGQSVSFKSTFTDTSGTPYFDIYFGDGSSTGVWWADSGIASSANYASHQYVSPGTYYAQAIILDTKGDSGVTQLLKVTVNPSTSTGPTISSFSASPNPVSPGSETTLSVSVTGGTSPYSYSYTNLPTGCTSADTSSLTCTPTSAGNYSVTVTVTDSADLSASKTLILEVSATSPIITSFTASPNPLTLGDELTLTVAVTSGTPTYTYSYSDLPPGCTSSNTPTLTCVPTSAGTYVISVLVTDSASKTASNSVSLDITSGTSGVLSVTSFTASPNPVKVNATVVLTVGLTGGTAPYSYAYSSLPPGCSTQNSDSLQCTPTTVGSYQISVTVTDAKGATASSSLALVVQAASTTGSTSAGIPAVGLLIVIIVIIIAVAAIILHTRRSRRSAQAPPRPGLEPPQSAIAGQAPDVASITPPPPAGWPVTQGPITEQPLGFAQPVIVSPPPPGAAYQPPAPAEWPREIGAESSAEARPAVNEPRVRTSAFCPYCGEKSQTRAKFCQMCGKELPTVPAQ